jgi:hypothetical protein
MNKLSIIVIASLCFGLGGLASAIFPRSVTAQSIPPNGRFQLFQGRAPIAGQDQNIIIRLDTLSGKTDIYFGAMKDGKITEGWSPLSE